MRCLEPAAARIEVDAREVEQADAGEAEDDCAAPTSTTTSSTSPPGPTTRWRSRCPGKFLCRPDCAGLCAVCGESLNDADPAEHRHASEPDPRWAKLRELKLD